MKKLLFILPLSFWLSCEDDTSVEETYSINGVWNRPLLPLSSTLFFEWMVIENEEVVLGVILMRQFSDTCYSLSTYTDRQLMQTDSLQFLYPLDEIVEDEAHDYVLTTIDSLSDNPLTWYQYYNLSKDTLWYKSYLCYWDSDECIPDDDWFYVRDDETVWEPECEM